MGLNFATIMFTVINFALLFAIIVVIYKVIQSFKSFINRNKEMEKKIDIILKKLRNWEDYFYWGFKKRYRLKSISLH